ncbi:MAG TPA: MoaD/ThiS family protein [Phycisphaerae bacterium]|nr:MoaD/ThiS family protein [Phycisphaerae bacterium]
MARVSFTQNIQRHIECPPCAVGGDTVRAVLDAVFARNPKARPYILDERGEVRKHMVIFVDGRPIRDRAGMSDAVTESSEVCVMQALSGG